MPQKTLDFNKGLTNGGKSDIISIICCYLSNLFGKIDKNCDF